MAQLKDILEEIEKGRGFKQTSWCEYSYISDGIPIGISIRDVLNANWELEPLPKEELKLFKAIFEITSYEKNEYRVTYMIPERLYKNEDDANANKPHFGCICEIKLLGLMPVTF